MDAPALQIEDLEKVYPTGTKALQRVSLEIPRGDFFGLLGPNGAGKSTLIHCTTGLAMPTGGSIRVVGMHLDLSGLWRRRQAAAILQHLAHAAASRPTPLICRK